MFHHSYSYLVGTERMNIICSYQHNYQTSKIYWLNVMISISLPTSKISLIYLIGHFLCWFLRTYNCFYEKSSRCVLINYGFHLLQSCFCSFQNFYNRGNILTPNSINKMDHHQLEYFEHGFLQFFVIWMY